MAYVHLLYTDTSVVATLHRVSKKMGYAQRLFLISNLREEGAGADLRPSLSHTIEAQRGTFHKTVKNVQRSAQKVSHYRGVLHAAASSFINRKSGEALLALPY